MRPNESPLVSGSLARLVALVGAAMFLEALLFVILAPLLPQYVDELGLSKSQAGLLAGSLPAGAVLGALPSGALATRIGGKRSVLVGLGALAAASVVFAATDDLAVMMASRCVQGAVGTAIWAGGLAWAAAVAPPDRRGAVLGSLLGIGIAGSVAGPLAGGLAVATSPTLVFGAVPVIAALLMAALARLPQPRDAVVRLGFTAVWRQTALRRVAAVNVLFVTLPAAALGLMGVLGPLRLDELGVGAGTIALVFLAAGALEASITPVAGGVADRVGTVRLLRVGMVGLAALLGAFALPDQGTLVAAVVIGVSLCLGLFGAPVNMNLHTVVTRTGAGDAYAFALFHLAFAAGHMIGTTGGGALADRGGDALPCLTLLVACLLAARLARRTTPAPLAAPA